MKIRPISHSGAPAYPALAALALAGGALAETVKPMPLEGDVAAPPLPPPQAAPAPQTAVTGTTSTVSIRALQRALGVTMLAEKPTGAFALSLGRNRISMRIGSRVARAGNRVLRMATAPYGAGGDTYVSTREVARALGIKVTPRGGSLMLSTADAKRMLLLVPPEPKPSATKGKPAPPSEKPIPLGGAPIAPPVPPRQDR